MGTIPAMQTVILPYDCFVINQINTALRAHRHRVFTADTVICYGISANFVFYASKCETVTLNRLFRKVKPLSDAFVNLKNGKCFSASILFSFFSNQF